MNRVIYIGMDVHSTSYTFCAMEPVTGGDDKVFGTTKVAPEYGNVVKYIGQLKAKLGEECEFICGYEAGCFGYALHNRLAAAGVNCVILAPSTMMSSKGKRIKTDARDAMHIAKCLAFGTYSPVYIPTAEDNRVKEYIRMRDDHKIALKKVKQQINAFCLRQGAQYDGKSKWTMGHVAWLRNLELEELDREALNEYLTTYEQYTNKLEVFDQRIEELAEKEEYAEKVKKLKCFLGIKTHTALALIVETGDFTRFAKGNIFATYLGLVPGENSSGDVIRRGGITKAGNRHARTLLVEAAQSFCKGRIGHKSKTLKARQKGNSTKDIAYADKANERLRRKYYRMIQHGKPRNVAVTAVARELACFVWGMMVGEVEAIG